MVMHFTIFPKAALMRDRKMKDRSSRANEHNQLDR